MNEIALFTPPAMPTVKKYDLDLGPDVTTSDYDWQVRVNKYTHLVPPAGCRSAIAEIDLAMRVAGPEQARAIAGQLFSRFPHSKLTLKSEFGVAMISDLMDYPADIGMSAAANLRRRLEFLPSAKELLDELDDLKKHRAHRKTVAEAHLAEHGRRQEEAEKDNARGTDLSPDERRAHTAQLQASVADSPKPPASKAKSRRKMKPISELITEEDREKNARLHADTMRSGGVGQVEPGDDGAGDGQDDVVGR